MPRITKENPITNYVSRAELNRITAGIKRSTEARYRFKSPEVMGREDIQCVYGLHIFTQNTFGTTDARIILPDGTVVSKAVAKVLTLSDGSEIFEVHIS
jgi:hypothetical protein